MRALSQALFQGLTEIGKPSRPRSCTWELRFQWICAVDMNIRKGMNMQIIESIRKRGVALTGVAQWAGCCPAKRKVSV